MKSLRVIVNRRHIATGIKHNPEFCPVALATKDACPKYNFLVYPSTVTIVSLAGEQPKFAGHGVPPNSVGDFIWAFDSGDEVQPFTFDLMVPDDIECAR